jgi:hypothetical protein
MPLLEGTSSFLVHFVFKYRGRNLLYIQLNEVFIIIKISYKYILTKLFIHVNLEDDVYI